MEIFMLIHSFICRAVFGGEAPGWLEFIHDLLGLTSFTS